MNYQLLAINKQGVFIGGHWFSQWVPIKEAVQTMRAEFPEAIGVLNWSEDFKVVWEDKEALAKL